jgi:hypothetical protein
MSQVPAEELQRLLGLGGYDQMLEIDRVCRQYGVDEETLRGLMTSFSQPSVHTQSTHLGRPAPPVGREAIKEMPRPAPPNIQPTYVNKDRFQFDYDPSVEAQQRRAMVEQAIVCPACGVALGIPSQRPIKVTCPQCLHVATFTQ